MGTGTHTRFEGVGKRIREMEGGGSTDVSEAERQTDGQDEDREEDEDERQQSTRPRKVPKSSKEALGALVGSGGNEQPKSKTRRKKKHRKAEE